MTTILTYQGNDYAAVASDTRVTGPYKDLGVKKIKQVGKYLLGNAGDSRAANILHNAFPPPVCKPSLRAKRLDDFITATFIPCLRGSFDMYGYSKPTSHTDANHMAVQDSHIVVVINGVVYIIYEDYAWVRGTGRIGGCGSGSPFAMGALEGLIGNRRVPVSDIKTVMLTAMKAAHRYDEYTSSPFHFQIQRRPK